MNKIKKTILLLTSLLSLLVAITPSVISTPKADDGVVSWFMCMTDSGQTVYKFAKTNYMAYLIRSKSAIASSETPDTNWFNGILNYSGYNVGQTTSTAEINVFERFGFAGLNYSSYAGEWKYYDINPCEDSAAKTSNLGEYYTGRLDPQSSFTELAASKDPRSVQYNKGFLGTLLLSMNDVLANMILWLGKLILSITLALIGLSFTDVADLLGITNTVQETVFKNLYNGFFVPMVVVMMILSACYIMYYGLLKRQYREAFVNGFVMTILSFLLAILLVMNPNLLSVPNKVATMAQTVVVSGLGDTISNNTKSDFCRTETGINNTSLTSDDFLENAADRMKSIVGCRMYSEFIFKPWVKGQWGTEYENLDSDDLNNINSSWVGSPDVQLGTKTISNWALFQVSIQSGYHIAVDGTQTANVGGVHKDWYRIVDALSNYDEEEVIYGSNSSGGSSSSSGVAGGDWLTEGTEANKLAKKVYEYLTEELGLSGAAAVGILANIEAESSWDINAIETAPTTADGAGVGLFQFTGGNRIQYAEWLQATGRDNDYKSQVDFVFEDELWSRAAESAFRTRGPVYGVTTSFPNIEAFLETSDYKAATEGFMFGYERPNESEELNHLRSRRLPNAEAASKVFDVKKKADRSKWKFDNPSASSTGGAVVSSTSGATGQLIVRQIVESDPLEEWNYWTGNRNGERIAQATLSLVLVIVGSVGPLVFGFASATYSIAMTLLMMLAPIFLLFGVWGGRGNRIMTSYFGSLLSVAIRKVVASFLLILSIILSSNTLALINKIGYFRAILFTIIITYVLIRNKDRLLDLVGSVNIGQLNLSSFSKGFNTVKQSAKFTAGLVTSTAVGGYVANSHGADVKAGMRIGAGEYIKNKLYATETGRSMTAYMNAAGQRGRAGIKTDCINCGRTVDDGTYGYFDDMGNLWCEDCAIASDFFDDFAPILMNNDENTVDMERTTYYGENNEIVSQPSYANWAEAGNSKDKNEILKQSLDSIKVYDSNIRMAMIENERIKKENSARKNKDTAQEVTLNKMVIADPIRKYVNAGELQNNLRSGKTDEFNDTIVKAYETAIETSMKNNNFTDEETKEILEQFKTESDSIKQDRDTWRKEQLGAATLKDLESMDRYTKKND